MRQMQCFLFVFLALFVDKMDAFISARTSPATSVSVGCSPSSRFALTMAGYGRNSVGRGRGRGPGQSSRGGIRQARVARSIRDEISSIICDMDIKAKVYPDEDLLRGTSVSEVEVSPDLSYAKIYISVLGNSVEKRQIFVWLCENVGQVRFSLAKRLRHMRRVLKLLSSSQIQISGGPGVPYRGPISATTVDDEVEVYEDFDEGF